MNDATLHTVPEDSLILKWGSVSEPLQIPEGETEPIADVILDWIDTSTALTVWADLVLKFVPGEEPKFEVGIAVTTPLTDDAKAEFYLLADYLEMVRILDAAVAAEGDFIEGRAVSWNIASQDRLDSVIAAMTVPHTVGDVVAMMAAPEIAA